MISAPMDLPPSHSVENVSVVKKRDSHYAAYLLKSSSKIPLLSIIRPKPTKNLAYVELRCSDEDQYAIGTIVSYMGEHGKIWLLAHARELNRMGDSIQSVHPLKFLETVFADEHLKVCMAELFKDYFKRTSLMEGLGGSLEAKASTKNLNKYIPEFCQAINVPQESVMPFFKDHAWEDLVRYLMHL